MAKIVIDARKLHTSTGRYVRELLKNLEKTDKQNDYTVLVHKEDIDPDQPHSWQPAPSSQNFRTQLCSINHYSFREALLMHRTLNKIKPDMVHFWMPQQPLFYRGKTVTTVHDLNYVHQKIYNRGFVRYELKRLVYKRVLKRFVRRSQAIITPSEWVKQDIINFCGLDAEKIFVTHEGSSDLAAQGEVVEQMKNKQFLLYVGQSSKYKGQLNLIKALQELRRSHHDLQLAIVGKPNSYTDKLQAIVADQSYQGVNFLGFVPDSQLAWLYKHTATYVQSSSSEGFGLMNLEAMQQNAPIASSNATSLPEVTGDAAEYFDPADITDMSQAINRILTDKKLARDLVARGKKQLKKFSWQKMTKQTLDVYRKALKQ